MIRHYKLKHCHHTSNYPLPCIYEDCVCSFRTEFALRKHLARDHKQSVRLSAAAFTLKCDLCAFSETCGITQYFTHLKTHLKNRESVKCPFQNCSFQSRVYSTFHAHKSKKHQHCGVNFFRTDIYQACTPDLPDSENTAFEDNPTHLDDLDLSASLLSLPCEENVQDLLHRKLASFFLRLQTVLHVSKAATQEIVNELTSIFTVAEEFTPNIIEDVLSKHNCAISDTVISAIKEIIVKANPFSSLTKSGPFSTEYKRTIFYKEHFQVIQPVEYVLDASSSRKCVYIPVLQTLSVLLNRNDVLDKLLQTEDREYFPEWAQFKSYRDGLYCKENQLLSSEDLSIALGLYIDDFEVCNPLGTSRKKHKICAVYWVLSNLPIRYRSSVQSIYLACLSYSSDVKKYGYSAILEPLLKDIEVLENQGIYVQKLGENIRGTVLYVSADNLGAHSLGGFQENFNVDKFCRFCLASRSEINIHKVSDGLFPLRTTEAHENILLELKGTDLVSVDGVKRDCALNRLSHFHTIQGFPPDFMHDVLEGVVPKELSFCLKSFISKHYFTFDDLNSIIQSFPFKCSDKINRPQQIPKSFTIKRTIGGNCHENWTLLRFLPLMIGDKVPENDKTWQIVLELKDIVELLTCGHFSEETLHYLEFKISSHRCLLKEVFPDFSLLPKHHFLEHYPELVRRFGPLVDFWTIRFEAKHSCFKRVIHDVRNFKNILLTLATKHQLTLAYCLDQPSLFKPDLEVGHVAFVSVDTLEHSMKQAIEDKFANITTVSLASHASLHGTKYAEGMFLSVGHTSGMPDFAKLVKILIVSNRVSFIIEPYIAWPIEHLRCYELEKSLAPELKVVEPHELNGHHPLNPYMRAGKLMVVPKTNLIY